MPKTVACRAVSIRPAPMPPHDGIAVEDLRARALAARVPLSPAVRAVIAGLAFATPENMRGAR